MVCAENGHEAIVQQSGLNEELGQVSYIFSDKTGTLTCNKMVFKQMSIRGVAYGDFTLKCPDAKERNVTNFDMVDQDLEAVLTSRDKKKAQFRAAQSYLYHLALCHTIVSSRNPRDESQIILNSSSPDELALLNAAKYYGVTFIERVEGEITIEDAGLLTEAAPERNIAGSYGRR